MDVYLCSVGKRDADDLDIRLIFGAVVDVGIGQTAHLIAEVAFKIAAFDLPGKLLAGELIDHPEIVERRDCIDVAHCEVGPALPGRNGDIGAEAPAVIKGCHSTVGGRRPQHQTGVPVSAAGFAGTDVAFLLKGSIDIAEHLVHFIADLIPGLMGDGEHRGIQMTGILRRVEKRLCILGDGGIEQILNGTVPSPSTTMVAEA